MSVKMFECCPTKNEMSQCVITVFLIVTISVIMNISVFVLAF